MIREQNNLSVTWARGTGCGHQTIPWCFIQLDKVVVVGSGW